jgi:uncharacterized protein YdaU (DUF1376 family)
MNKSPAFQFYPNDFLQGSKLMTLQERGAYITLLCEQWDVGGLTGEAIELARLLGCHRRDAERLWGRVVKKFVKGEDHLWRNARLERERQKQEARRLALSHNGSQGGRGRKANTKLTQSKKKAIALKQESYSLNSEKLKQSLSSSASQDQIKERSDRTPVVPKSESAIRGRFDAFWAEYPNKKAKGAAWNAWRKLAPTTDHTAQMIDAIRAQRHSREWREGFIPHPATWLNQERWSDEIDGATTPAIEPPMPAFFDECPKCGDIHELNQPCPENPKPASRWDPPK